MTLTFPLDAEGVLCLWIGDAERLGDAALGLGAGAESSRPSIAIAD